MTVITFLHQIFNLSKLHNTTTIKKTLHTNTVIIKDEVTNKYRYTNTYSTKQK